MKKQVLALAVLSMLTANVWAAEPTTVLEKTNVMETTVYGKVQEGALVDRVNQLGETVYGSQPSGNLNTQVDSLYTNIEGTSTGSSLRRDVDMLEWRYSHAVTGGSLIDRVDRLERSINGRISTGSLDSRVAALRKIISGSDAATKTQQGTIAADHVFKVTLNTAVSTKTNKVNDPVSFTVAEDIMDGDVLLVPKGTVGTGHISELKKAGSFGRNAKLDIIFDNIPTIDGQSFTGSQGKEAKEKTKSELTAAGASVAGAVLLGPIGLVGGFFVKGQSIELPVGSEIYIQPQTAITVTGPVIEGYVPDTASAAVSTADQSTDTTADTADTTAAVSDNHEDAADTTEHETASADDTAAHKDSTAEADTAAATTNYDSSSSAAPAQPIIVVKRT